MNLRNQKKYQLAYGTLTLKYIHSKRKQHNIEIPSIINGDLFFTLLIILSDLPHDYPRESLFNSSRLIYKADQESCKKFDEISLKYLYEV